MTTLNSTLTSAALRPLLSLLNDQGLSLFELTKFNDHPDADHFVNHRISTAEFDRLVERAGGVLRRTDLGLALGQHLKFSDFYLLPFLLSSCHTGREVLSLLRRYYSLVISDTHAPDVFVGQQSIKLMFYVAPGSSYGAQVRTELVASGIHSAGLTFGSKLYDLEGVGFRFPRPAYAAKLEDFFGVQVKFDEPHNWISFSSKFLDTPLVQANFKLFNYLRERAADAIARFGEYQEHSARVMHVLYQWPESVAITKESVAELLNTSSRTLTRRLQEEGSQFSNLLREVRLEKAKQALQEGYSNVQQLALDLGFSDRRGFERAFKQWTGATPAAYRKQFLEQEERLYDTI